MTRIQQRQDLQRAEQEKQARQKQTQEKNTAERQQTRENFAQSMAKQKREKSETTRQGQVSKQTTGQDKKRSGRHMADGQKFHAMLNKHQANKQGVDQSHVKHKDESMDETRQSDSSALSKLNHEEALPSNDQLAAIDGDGHNQGGGGGFEGDAGGSSEGHDPGSMAMGAPIGEMQQAQTTQQAQGAQAPQIPAAVLQELVKRVMVGVNQEGLSEFHIQFKDDVLNGTSLQISAKDGKITTKFIAPDENTARLIKASEGQLARALPKGLSLELLEVTTA